MARSINKMKKLSVISNQFADKGQSLLEVTVLVGLALITVSGLVIVTVNGLKNSQYSQNQAQATKLAQEGMDEVKGIVQRNCAVSNGGNYLWFNSQTGTGSDLVWNHNFGQTFQIVNYSTCDLVTPGLVLGTHDITPTATQIFTRDILIADDSSCASPSDCKLVTVTVNWTDFSGQHQSRLVTVLTEN